MALQREAAAAVAIPLVLGILFFLPPLAFSLLVAAIGLATLWEFYRIAEKTGLPVARNVGILAGAAVLGAAAWSYSGEPGGVILRGSSAIVFALLLALLSCVPPLFTGVESRRALGGASATAFGVLSIALPATSLDFLRVISPRAVLYLFLIVWGCDSFAYYSGRAFGRRKLAPRVSPNKTWEGTIGGLAGATVIGAAGGTWWLLPGLGPVWGAAAGALVSSAGQIGDLVESLWKRGAGVKDSGTFLPGHGGFYDRIDSLLFAGPTLAALLTLKG